MTISTNLPSSIGHTLPRVLPFAVFMAFVAIQEGAQHLGSTGSVIFPDNWFLFLYPVKTIAVGFILLAFRKRYSEIHLADLKSIYPTIASVLLGVSVCCLWVNMDWPWATFGTPKGFNPMTVSENLPRYILISFRLIGASLIVPIMEELFWRSWLMRYIISSEFQSIELGKFSVHSFIIATIMFGMEHNLWLAGMMAGAIYSYILYRTKSLMQCILAHAITNFVLGIFVLQTNRWEFW